MKGPVFAISFARQANANLPFIAPSEFSFVHFVNNVPHISNPICFLSGGRRPFSIAISLMA